MKKVVIFYEKPGCATNAKQKKGIRQAGCFVIERDLLNNDLDKETLYAFLQDKPVQEWFNPNAPKIKSKEIDPLAFDKESALELLLQEPLLIKRPLMVIGRKKLCGFDNSEVQKILDTEFTEEISTECSSKTDLCPSH